LLEELLGLEVGEPLGALAVVLGAVDGHGALDLVHLVPGGDAAGLLELRPDGHGHGAHDERHDRDDDHDLDEAHALLPEARLSLLLTHDRSVLSFVSHSQLTNWFILRIGPRMENTTKPT